tara:strand:+ start:451 stop:966 length:516 start_codon:yes stop_codon:yes gene_type:complete
LKKSLVLTGMMGVGKSTVGKSLSVYLKIPFIDVDRLIEEKEGSNIEQIFSKKGEAYFREKEREATLKILDRGNLVIALGGGAFIDNIIRKKVLKTCLSFWLDAKIKFLLTRFAKSKKRPLLNNNDAEKTMNKIYLNRKNIYKLANFRIDCDKLNKLAVVKKISEIYENNSN